MKQVFDIIPDYLIKYAIDDYNSKSDYKTITMNKADPTLIQDLFLPLIQSTVGKKIKVKSGNYYKHTISYLPHTDYKKNQNNTINVVIPLWYQGMQSSLIVFDQMWYKDSVTWCLTNPIVYFDTNTGILGNPCDYEDVKFLTNKEIDLKFWLKYLNHYPRKCFYGLSGNAFPFQPKSLIIFDNRHIHCTSKMKGEKLGLSLRYEYIN